MKGVTFFLIALIFFLFLNSCNTTEPPDDNNNLQPGRRDYSWEVDTIPVQNASFEGLWASSPENIWICGDAVDRRESIWHFNGTNWEPINESVLWPATIFGFANDNIWVGTSASRIYHFNGTSWTINKELEYEGFSEVKIEEIYGNSPEDIYACGMADGSEGYRGIILHYNGIDWEFLNLPEIPVVFASMIYDTPSDSYLIYGANFDHIGTSERIYVLKNNNVTEIYANDIIVGVGNIGKYGYVFEADIPTTTNKIYRYENGRLNLFVDLSNTVYAGRIWGRSEQDFFCVNWGTETELGGIGHYNGENLVTIFPFYGFIPNALIFDNYVFFLGAYGWTDDTQVVIKGKLGNQ